MKGVELYGRVRHAVQIEGLSHREAARRFGIDPRTVRKMMMFSVPPGYRRSKLAARPKLDPFVGIIERILDEDSRRPAKQRYTSKRIFERLRDEHGFAGGITIVKDYVSGWHQRSQQMFIPLAHPPGHAQADFGEALGRAVGNPNTDSGEACREAALGATPPTDRPPAGGLQHRLRSDRLRIRDMPLARAAASGNGEDHRHVGGIDLLLERDADGPSKAARGQRLSERGAQAISGIGKDAAETHAGRRANPVDLGQGDLGLGPVGTMVIRHTGAIEPGGIGSPTLRQEQPQPHHDRHFARS